MKNLESIAIIVANTPEYSETYEMVTSIGLWALIVACFDEEGRRKRHKTKINNRVDRTWLVLHNSHICSTRIDLYSGLFSTIDVDMN